MAVGIGAAGILGVGRETTNGTWIAPEKFVPILNEGLKVVQSNIYRRPIRGLADPVGAVAGNFHVEGSITMEVLDDCLPYFMYAMRGAISKGGAGNYTYTLTPNAEAEKSGSKKTLSLYTERNGVVFGYFGCVVASYQFTVQDGILVCTLDILGEDEATQSGASPTWPTTIPPGPGEYTIEIPTSSGVCDVDTFTFSVDDGAEAAFRLCGGRGAAFIQFGEREVTLSVERDFESRTDYDAFKAATAHAVTIKAAKGANNYLQIDLEAGVKDTYEVGLSGQGDLVRASIEYQGVYSSGDSRSFQVVCATQENLT